MKPLINIDTVKEKSLTIEDLNYIYERTHEYQLDSELKIQVERYRIENNYPINYNYDLDIQMNNRLKKN